MNYDLNQFRKLSDFKYYILLVATIPMSILTLVLVPTLLALFGNVLGLAVTFYLCHQKHNEELRLRAMLAENDDWILEYTHSVNRRGNA
jgi:hypothetical protein